MCGPENCDRIGTHKEAEATRVSRDERDVQKLFETFKSGLLSDPFQIPEEISEEEIPLTLSNLATGVVLPGADGSILLNAEELGRKSMETFLSSRIQRNEINFWDPIQRLKIKTFSSVAKKVAVSKQKDKTVTVNADRELFGRFWLLRGTGILISKRYFLMSFAVYQSHLYILMAASGRRQKAP